MTNGMIIGSAFILALIISILIPTLIDWSASQPDEGPKVSYKIFKTSYAINPNRWGYSESYLDFRPDISRHFSTTRVKYSYLDWWRLHFFFSATDKRKARKRDSEETAKLLAVIQQDIEAELNKSKEEIEEAHKMMENLRAGWSSSDTSCQEAL